MNAASNIYQSLRTVKMLNHCCGQSEQYTVRGRGYRTIIKNYNDVVIEFNKFRSKSYQIQGWIPLVETIEQVANSTTAEIMLKRMSLTQYRKK